MLFRSDQSSFDTAAPLFDDDSQLESVWRKEYKLQPFIARSEFKTYDELKAKLHRVLGLGASTKQEAAPWEDQPATKPAPIFKAKEEPKFQTEDDDDESMELFKKLAAEE